MIIHFIHCNTDTLRTGSVLFLIALRARWTRIRKALAHRINRHLVRHLRHHTAKIRAAHGRAGVALPETGAGAVKR